MYPYPLKRQKKRRKFHQSARLSWWEIIPRLSPRAAATQSNCLLTNLSCRHRASPRNPMLMRTICRMKTLKSLAIARSLRKWWYLSSAGPKEPMAPQITLTRESSQENIPSSTLAVTKGPPRTNRRKNLACKARMLWISKCWDSWLSRRRGRAITRGVSWAMRARTSNRGWACLRRQTSSKRTLTESFDS